MPKQICREVIFAQYLMFLLQASHVFLMTSWEQNSVFLFICPHKSLEKPPHLCSVPLHMRKAEVDTSERVWDLSCVNTST